MMPDPHKIRRESLRWLLIRALYNARPEGANEAVIVMTVQGVFADATQLEVRRELDYLHQRELAEVKKEPSGRWYAHITRHGVDVAEYTVECDAGIARPVKYWE